MILNQRLFKWQPENLPEGFSIVGKLPKEEHQEAAMRVLHFSREDKIFRSVTIFDLVQHFHNDTSSTILKAIGGESRLRACIDSLVKQGLLSQSEDVISPTPLLVKKIMTY